MCRYYVSLSLLNYFGVLTTSWKEAQVREGETRQLIEQRMETSIEDLKKSVFQDVVTSLPFQPTGIVSPAYVQSSNVKVALKIGLHGTP